MRYFGGLLFHGGQMARAKVEFLRERFQEALELQSGLQQPDHEDASNRQEAASVRTWDEAELEDAVRDLVAALLGRELVLGGPLAYPWDEAALGAVLGD